MELLRTVLLSDKRSRNSNNINSFQKRTRDPFETLDDYTNVLNLILCPVDSLLKERDKKVSVLADRC